MRQWRKNRWDSRTRQYLKRIALITFKASSSGGKRNCLFARSRFTVFFYENKTRKELRVIKEMKNREQRTGKKIQELIHVS